MSVVATAMHGAAADSWSQEVYSYCSPFDIGVPSPANDIQLGDVVVGTPQGTEGEPIALYILAEAERQYRGRCPVGQRQSKR